MVIEIPDNVLEKRSDPEIRIEVAIALFKKKLLPASVAADMAGISKQAFDQIIADRSATQEKPTYPNHRHSTLPDQVSESEIIFGQLTKPIQTGFDFDAIVKRQGYKGPNKASLQKSIRALDVKESLEDLLASIN